MILITQKYLNFLKQFRLVLIQLLISFYRFPTIRSIYFYNSKIAENRKTDKTIVFSSQFFSVENSCIISFFRLHTSLTLYLELVNFELRNIKNVGNN